MGPIIGIMNILEVNFYFCTLLAEILRYFDNSDYILQKNYRTNTTFHLLSFMNCVLALKWLVASWKRIYRANMKIFIWTSCYNTAQCCLFRTKIRHFSLLAQKQKKKDILAYFFILLRFLRFYIINRNLSLCDIFTWYFIKVYWSILN